MKLWLFLLVVLAYATFAKGKELEKPIRLEVIKGVCEAFIRGWVDGPTEVTDKIIILEDVTLIVNVKRYQSGRGKHNVAYALIPFVTLLGELTIEQWTGDDEKWEPKKLPVHDVRKIKNMYYQGGMLFLENPEDGGEKYTEFILENFFLINYEPPSDTVINSNKEPIVRFESYLGLYGELFTAAEEFRKKSNVLVTGAYETVDMVTIKNKDLKAAYEKVSQNLELEGDIRAILTSPDDKVLLTFQTFNKIRFNLLYKAVQQWADLPLYAVYVGPYSLPTSDHKVKTLRMQLVQDVKDVRPTYAPGLPGIESQVKMDDMTMFNITYTERQEGTFTRISSTGMSSMYGDNIDSLCLHDPEDSYAKSRNEERGNLLEGYNELFFFSCGDPDDARQNQRSIFSLPNDFSFVLSSTQQVDRHGANRIGKTIHYITHDKFKALMNIIAENLKVFCSSDVKQARFRLFTDIYARYDCESKRLGLSAVRTLVNPEGKEHNGKHLKTEFQIMEKVVYDPIGKAFVWNSQEITNFVVRLTFDAVHGQIPVALLFDNDHARNGIRQGIHFPIEVQSFEWDLQHIFEGLKSKSIHTHPKAGVVLVDGHHLFVAELVQKHPTRKLLVEAKEVKKCENAGSCLNDYPVRYDGTQLSDRDGHAEINEYVYFPEEILLHTIKSKYSILHREFYTSQRTFTFDLERISEVLRHNYCERSKPKRYNFVLHYNNHRHPVVGVFDCDLQYLKLYSHLKAITHPPVSRVRDNSLPADVACPFPGWKPPSRSPSTTSSRGYIADQVKTTIDSINKLNFETGGLLNDEDWFDRKPNPGNLENHKLFKDIGVGDTSAATKETESDYSGKEDKIKKLEEQLRVKFDKNVLKGIIFHPETGSLNARNAFVDRVYAVRALFYKNLESLKTTHPGILALDDRGFVEIHLEIIQSKTN